MKIMNKKQFHLLPLVALISMSLSGCESFATYHRVDAVEKETQSKVNAALEPHPSVTVHNGAWLLGEKIAASKPHPMIYDHVVAFNPGVQAGGQSLTDIAAWIAQNAGVPTRIDSSVDASETADAATGQSAKGSVGRIVPPSVSMASPMMGTGTSVAMGGELGGGLPSESKQAMIAFKGTLKEFLNVVDARYGVWSRYQDGTLTFFKTETKSFSVAVLPGTSALKGTISTTGTSSGGSSSGSSGGSSTGSAGSQSIVVASELDPWKNLEKTAQAVAGKRAIVVADADLSMITVTGTPLQVGRVESFIKSVNAMYGKQVALDVRLYQIQRTTEDNYGANLALAFASSSGHTGLTLTSVSAPTVSGTATPMRFGATITGGRLSGSSAAIQALSTLGKVAEVISRSGITQNGRVLALQAAKEEGYVQSTSTTSTTSVGSTTSIQTGTLVPGFTSSFVPKVVDGKILLDFDITLSNLESLVTFTSGGTANQSSVQLPTMDMTRLTQSVTLKPGETLILTGLNNQNTSTTNNDVGSAYLPILGGGLDATKHDEMIAVVITARLL